jgi:hypothetical protein
MVGRLEERVLATGCVRRAVASFLCALEQLEDHGERGPVGQTALRSDGAVAHGGEGAFNGIGYSIYGTIWLD